LHSIDGVESANRARRKFFSARRESAPKQRLIFVLDLVGASLTYRQLRDGER